MARLYPGWKLSVQAQLVAKFGIEFVTFSNYRETSVRRLRKRSKV